MQKYLSSEYFLSLITDHSGILVGFVGRCLAALAVLVIGFWVARIVSNIIIKMMKKQGVDETLVTFLSSVILNIFRILVLISAVGFLGVQTSAFVAILGSAGLAIGLAFSGSLGNLASGMLIILFRPYRVGDLVEINGVLGDVKEIQIFNTILISRDNQTIILPNAVVTSDTIINHTASKKRRVDVMVGIGYEDDIDKARDIILRVLDESPDIHGEPGPSVVVHELADSSVNLRIRFWTDTDGYRQVGFKVNEAVKKAFDAEGVNIPYPQREITMKNG